MASVPAEVNGGNADSQQGEGQAEGSAANRSNLLLGFNRLSLLRQVALLFAVAASVALGFALVLWVQQPSYQPVLGNMSQYDPQNVTQVLDQAGIDYKIQPSSGALLVPSDQVFQARMKLAAAGVTNNKSAGFELLDKSQGLGTSQFMEMARYRQALQGELERTISSLQAVHSARVHLAIPKESVFVNDNRKPSASVFVDVFAGRRLSHEQVQAIVNLVASSVPEMGRKDVTVVDQKGNLLTGSDDESPVDQQADTQLKYTHNYESMLNQRIANLLRPIVGDGRFRSEVSADLDFSSQEQAQELYNPDQKALRSEHVINEKRSGDANGGVPGALSNQPPGNAKAQAMASNVQQQNNGNNQNGAQKQSQSQSPTDVRQQSTRNYELDRTLNYTRRAVGQVQRLTVAVAVDDVKTVDPQTGKVTYKPWSKEQLQRLTMLVRDAVGYSAARGDSVTVVNTAFAPEQKQAAPTVHFWEQDWFQNAIRPAAGVLIVLVIALLLVRPTLKNLAASGRSARDEAIGGVEDMEGIEGGSAIRDALSHSEDLLLPDGGDGYDRQLNTLKGLIAEDPARVAQVIRQWVNADD